ncbi:acetolactate synthase, large subunit [Limimonas halophila]|uniref:Acetolactate synthase n=1 Tax=Limimonas halophila TaxID=1082479 RepID=A0A1G7L176_9PROT|nr:acetolactate synthase 3 large subunit [Limimonas halophila]SDF43084.1 acetolactate synthase, large subunit [Limimonas halophila]
MTDESMTGAQMVLKALEEQGVEAIFGYPGGAVLPIYDALYEVEKLHHILVRHEQGAVHAAEGYARSSNQVGVALVTSGPGATNAVTGLTDAMMDSIPVVCLTGQVPTHLIGNDAFQEADTTGITRPCTKHNYLVKSIADLPRIMHEAFHVARSGRPGPVVVDLPKDVLQAQGTYVPRGEVRHRTYNPQTRGDAGAIAQAVELLANAKRPIIYTGGGVINSGPEAAELLTAFARATGAPITNTVMGLGAYPGTDPQFLGMLGMHGTYEANMAMHDCDVMLAIGARFDDRVTGKVSAFAPYSKKIQIDIDPSSINKNVVVDVPIVGDVREVLSEMLRLWREGGHEIDQEALSAWWKLIGDWRSVECLKYEQLGDVIKPQYAIDRLAKLTETRDDVYITTEVGQHQMWAAQYITFNKPNRWMTSGGLGTMGYGLPAAVGTQVANPDALVVDVAGEASILMNMQEMSTLVQYGLPVKIFIVNNQWMGMVRQWQELLHGERYSQSYTESLPDFVKLAEAYGATGLRATKPGEVDDVIQQMIDTPGPVIVDCCVDQVENCFPMIPAGAAHNEILLGPEDTAAEEDADTQNDGMVLV